METLSAKVQSAWYKQLTRQHAVLCCKVVHEKKSRFMMYNRPLSTKKAFQLAKDLKSKNNTVDFDMTYWSM